MEPAIGQQDFRSRRIRNLLRRYTRRRCESVAECLSQRDTDQHRSPVSRLQRVQPEQSFVPATDLQRKDRQLDSAWNTQSVWRNARRFRRVDRFGAITESKRRRAGVHAARQEPSHALRSTMALDPGAADYKRLSIFDRLCRYKGDEADSACDAELRAQPHARDSDRAWTGSARRSLSNNAYGFR